MTAPFAPVLTSPASKSASASPLTLKAKHRTGAAGDPATAVAIRRRVMTPSVGSYEYWNGTSWVGSEAFNAITSLFDSQTYEFTNGTSWTTNQTYQWTMRFRNGASEAGPYAPDSLVHVHAVPSMAVTVSGLGGSRPLLSWVSTIASGFYQAQYQLAIYTDAVKTSTGFNPADPAWQALATWISPIGYGSADYQKRIGADLVSGVLHWAYYNLTDSGGLASGWTSGTSFTPSFTAFPAPTLTLTPDLVNGKVDFLVRSAFNLLSENQSSFTTGIDGWVGTLNCQAEFPNNGTLLLRAGGMSYNAMDAAYSDINANDTAFASYTAQAAAQSSPAGTSRAQMGLTTGEWIPVSPSTVYSAVFDAICNVAGRNVKCGIRWYTAGGAAATTPLHQGSAVGMSIVSYVTASCQNVTSPANAAFASIEVEWTTSVAGTDIVNVKNVAFAAAASIAWSPTGNNFDVSFSLEKSLDGENWEAVWGMSQNNPRPSDIGVLTEVSGSDRSAFLGVDGVQYRAYAVTKFSTAPLWSSVVVQSLAPMTIDGWRLRHTTDEEMDIVGQPINRFSYSSQLNNEIVPPEGLDFPVVISNDQPNVSKISFVLILTNQAAMEKALASLRSAETLYVQTNRAGMGYYFKPTGAFRYDGRPRVPDLVDTPYATVGTYYELDVEGVEVKPYEG